MSETAPDLGGGVFELTTERYARGELAVASFRGREDISRPFSFDILIAGSEIEEASIEQLLGRRACLTMRVGGQAPRRVHGIVLRFEAEGTSGGREGRHRYRAWLAPALRLAGEGKNTRIFQDLTVQEIVDRVLTERQVERQWRLIGAYAPREYCVQHGESDLDFVQRLLAEEGMFYFFDHPDADAAAEVMVIADHVSACAPIDGVSTLEFRDSGGMEEGDFVRRFRLRRRVRSGAVLLKEFDFLRPSLDLSASAAVPPGEGAVGVGQLRTYDHHGEFERGGSGLPAAARRLEQERVDVTVGSGVSRCRRLLPGRWIELRDSAIPEHDGRYTVFRIEHEGRTPEISGASAGGPREVYRNTFKCVPASVACRPRAPTRRLQQTMETATVVGPAGHEIHTDAHGRIRVQFHWDLQGQRNEHSSCWIRCLQSWAGVGWGTQFIPRIGMEVMVAFLEGDTDRPLVMGSVYNAEHPPPFSLPAHKTRSGIRTQSSRGGSGFNELSFEDRAGREAVFLHAQKDLEVVVRNEHTTRVGANQVDAVTGSKIEIVGVNRVASITGDDVSSVAGSQRATVEGDSSRHVHRASAETVGGDAHEHVEGARRVVVGAAQTHFIQQDAREYVNGDHLGYVRGADARVVDGDAQATVRGSASINVGKALSLVVGAGAASARIGGDLRASVGGGIRLGAEDEIRLSVGDSSIVITGDAITFESKSLVLAADGVKLLGSGSSLLMGDNVDLHGKKIKASAEGGATLNLDSNAALDGSAIKLGSGDAAEKAKREERSKQSKDLPKETVKLFDRRGELIHDAPYQVSFPGYLVRGVAAGGEVEIPKFPDVEVCHLAWGRPAARREAGAAPGDFEFAVDIYLREQGPTADETLRRKLNNLGFVGELHEAVYAFQTAIGAPRTGAAADVRDDVDQRHQGASPIKPR